MATEIEFPFGEFWQPIEEYVGFRAMIGKDRIDCSVTQKALNRYFKGKGQDPIVVFKANRPAIQAVAEAKIKKRGKKMLEGPCALDVDDFKK